MKSVKIPGGIAAKGVAAGLAGAAGVLLVIKLAWWVLSPMQPVLLAFVIGHAVVKLYTAVAKARARVLHAQTEARRGHRG
ncbi:hypothetical protein [Pseudofrankia sp. BMG5.37]|uniref:hypothetical protein n=1 Tax=Pseudofrankia sp. BMG5.37 TaxID=3050035 RepID=UPI0028948BFC|nr:hypothetical protein [Pseudofrankia sp. BMG5.37]MDT3438277.1 hypothetical protein [Pseudofrankia sp. BMG5.37]